VVWHITAKHFVYALENAHKSEGKIDRKRRR